MTRECRKISFSFFLAEEKLSLIWYWFLKIRLCCLHIQSESRDSNVRLFILGAPKFSSSPSGWGARKSLLQVMLVVKNLPANAGDARDMSSIPGLRRSPGGGNGKPLQYSCLENPMDRGAWWATVHGVTKSRTWLKQLCMHARCFTGIRGHTSCDTEKHSFLFPSGFLSTPVSVVEGPSRASVSLDETTCSGNHNSNHLY